MKILVRTKDMQEWRLADSLQAKAEVELQDLLHESPSLIPIDEIREDISPFICAIKEFGLPGSGATDLLAFNDIGNIAIVECKLATNPEIKRKVIGQILEYASYLWKMSYEEFNNRIKSKTNKDLIDFVRDSLSGDFDFNEEEFTEGIKNSLNEGIFFLFIAVDEINDELRNIINYINKCGDPKFSLCAIELHRFKISEIDIIIPRVYGIFKEDIIKESRKKWSEKELLEYFENNFPSEIAQVVKDIYLWSKEKADRIWFGTGKETGSFTFHYIKDGRTISMFTIYTNGKIMLNYGWLKDQINEEVLKEFHKKIKSIPSFNHIPDDLTKWPSLDLTEAFQRPEYIDEFKNIIEWAAKQIK